MFRIVLLAVLVVLGPLARSEAAPISVVAAENFYGDVARQIGGRYVEVTSILNNPQQDPHLFEASVSTARLLSHARVVIYNGLGYDAWIEKLLGAGSVTDRAVMAVAALLHKQPGANPHLWYDPAAMPALARALAQRLATIDAAHRAYFQQRLSVLLRSLAPLDAKIRSLRQKYAGLPVTATEPVFGYMADALGLAMRNTAYQRAIMNGTEPGPSTVAAFENDLKAHRVKVVIHNRQTSSPAVQRLLAIARAEGIPVVGVTETEPPDTRYQDWMMDQLDALGRALAGAER